MFARAKRPTHTIDMAPLIDVVFLLLIFFMLTSTFQNPSLPLALPAAQAGSPTPVESIEIRVDARGQIEIAGVAVALDRVDAVLAGHLAAAPAAPVSFHGDRDSNFGLFVDLMGRAKAAGATQLHIVHETLDRP